MPRFIALDIGEKRIGVALSGPLNITAQGQETIKRKNPGEALDKIKALVRKYDVRKIIVGMPFNMNGTKGRSAQLAEEFGDLLKKELHVNVEMVDERLTTLQGERVLLEANISREKRKLFIDKIAAQLILQVYLDSHVQKNKP